MTAKPTKPTKSTKPRPTKETTTDSLTSNSFAQEIGEITMTEDVSNSYYNDESYVSCKSADLDKAYKAIIKYKRIGTQELESKIEKECKEHDEPIVFDGLEVLKMTLAGDFGNQYKKTSSYSLYYQACLHSWKAMFEELGKKETLRIWTSKKNERKEGLHSNMSDREYQKVHLSTRSLADMIAGVIRWDDFEADRKDDLKIAKALCSKLIGIEGFKKSLEGFSHNSLQRSYEMAETETEKQKIKDNITQAATWVLYEQFDKIQNINDYYLRKATISATLTGDSGDKFFNQTMKTIPTPKSKLIDNTKEEVINI